MVKEFTKDEFGTKILAVENGQLIAGHYQDVEPILEANKAQYNNAESGWRGDIHHVARIPAVFVQMFMNEFNCTFQQLMSDPDIQKKIVAKLNSNDHRFLRTKPGVISWR